ncbi:ABC transporter [Arthrobacter sp. ZBG10]|uniref:ABC transporter ATP-binding protein n=1 Tax=Arthrobacter sp. ZBG10 TaxID=1676590 RepID=UPI0006814478|nr:ABC transporter ATP-binding protein [Arthrobacter sp. ZBG10]KNH22979.1 ABC transporter [Arthrobacter sp. ZBG10]
MTESGAVLEAGQLLVGYGGVPVCGEVALAVRAGEILGVVGVNGAGKSTVAQTLAGRQPALSGDVRIQGLLVDRDAVNFRRQVAAVFDDDLFFPSLSVAEHLLLVARGHSLANAEECVAAELDFFGLTDRATAVPDALSSGQRRRLLLAAGFIRPASLLILDEPEQRLDPVMRDALAGRIREHAAAGGAVLLVTHDPTLLVRTATSCLVIKAEVATVPADEGAAFIAGL